MAFRGEKCGTRKTLEEPMSGRDQLEVLSRRNAPFPNAMGGVEKAALPAKGGGGNGDKGITRNRGAGVEKEEVLYRQKKDCRL